VQITGAAVPNEASSVAVNVTVTGASAGSHVTAFPTGASQPAASTINFAAGATTANLAVVRLGDGGRISLANAVGTTHVVLDVVGHVHVVIDIAGYFDPTAGSRYHALNPSRILDSRTGLGASGPCGANVTREIPRAAATLPADVTAIVSDLTVTDGSHASFVTIYPHGTSLPNASNVNFAAGQTTPSAQPPCQCKRRHRPAPVGPPCRDVRSGDVHERVRWPTSGARCGHALVSGGVEQVNRSAGCG